MKTVYKLMIVAGEASGDLHAAKLVNALREEIPRAEFEFFGCAGPRMRGCGVEPIVQADSLSVVGLPEIARALPTFLRAFSKLKRAAAERRPHAVILVDFPDFNLKLARSLWLAGHRVIYYISPQLWAWREYRVRTIRKYVDLLITILPFEKAFYASRGIDHVAYVGSPLAMEVHADKSKEDFCAVHGLDPARPIVSLLPGSRHKEIAKILPEMLVAADLLARRHPGTQFLAALGSRQAVEQVNTVIGSRGTRDGSAANLKLIENDTYNALNASDAAAVASGTATLETGIIGTPMAIVYKASSINYRLLRPLITVEHFGLINLIAEKRVAAELIQDDFTAATLCNELQRILSPDVNASFRADLLEAKSKLGSGGASRRAAKLVIDRISRDTY